MNDASQALYDVVTTMATSMMLMLILGQAYESTQPPRVIVAQCSTSFMDRAHKVHFQFTDICEVETKW